MFEYWWTVEREESEADRVISKLDHEADLGEKPLISKVLSGHSHQKCLRAALT